MFSVAHVDVFVCRLKLTVSDSLSPTFYGNLLLRFQLSYVTIIAIVWLKGNTSELAEAQIV